MTKIATGSYLQSLATNGGGGSFGLTSSKCYTYQSILELNGFLISSVLDNDRLVKESLISYSIPSVTHYYAYGPWYWDVNTSSTIYINYNYSHRSDISNNFLSNFTQIDECAIVFEKYDNINNRYYFEFDDGLLTGSFNGKFTLFNITSNGSKNIAVDNNTPILADSEIDTYSERVGNNRYLLGGLIDQSSDQEYNSEINDLLSLSYVIPIKYNDYSYLQFFESIDGSHGWFDPMLGNSDKHIFIPYSTQDYYVTGVYNDVSCVFKFRLRYFTNSLSNGINIDSLININSVPYDTYQYGSAGDIFNNYNLNTYTHNNFTGSAIGTAEISQEDGYGNIEFYDDIDRPSLRYNGNYYNRLILGSYVQNGSISWNGSTYPLYDATNILVSAPQDGINVNTGGSGSGGTTVEEYRFINYSKENNISVFKINNVGTSNAVYTYLGTIYSDLGEFSINLTQDDIDNENTRGFAFGCDIGSSISSTTLGGVVSLAADDCLDAENFYNSSINQYEFSSYDVSLSVGGLPLYDSSVEPYTLQYITVHDLRGLDSWTTSTASTDAKYIGLTNYTNNMYTGIDFEVTESSFNSVTVYLYYDGLEVMSRTVSEGNSDFLSMETSNHSYHKYQIKFDYDVELYYKYGNNSYPILYEGYTTIPAGTYINVDKIRGAAQGGAYDGLVIMSLVVHVL